MTWIVPSSLEIGCRLQTRSTMLSRRIARLKNLPIVRPRSFHLAHVTKAGELQRVFEMTRFRFRFTDSRKQTTKLLDRGSMQIFVAQEHEIGPAPEFLQPIVHCLNHQSDAENRIAEYLPHGLALEFIGCLGGASRQFNIVRNERIPWIAREQNDSGSLNLATRDQKLASSALPPTRL